MGKRLTALLLCLCMVLTMLPVSAMAAVGDLLGNTPEQNASLLEKLESFTGESAEEAQQLLDSLGLLDEDGNLITDQTIDLDGKQYTLEEMEALLEDPSTDLTRVAQVDGVPIALQDLQTIVAIERELQYLQETYFSGRTFSGEAQENLNGLLNQLQTQGMTLNATTPGNEVVLSQTGEASLDGYDVHYISASDLQLEEGDTFKVKFKLAIPESIKKFGGSKIVVGFRNSLTSGSQWLASETIVVASDADPNREYELTYTVKQGDYTTSSLYLAVWYELSSFGTIDFNALSTFHDYSFGTLSGGVSFYEPEGFLFGDGSGKKAENWNCFFDYELNHPELVGEWKKQTL